MINPVLAAMIVVNAAGVGFTAYLLHLTGEIRQTAKDESLRHTAEIELLHTQTRQSVVDANQFKDQTLVGLSTVQILTADVANKKLECSALKDRCIEISERAFEFSKIAELHADTAKDHVDTAAMHVLSAYGHVNSAREHAEASADHADHSKEHAKHSGVISKAVTEAAQKAASKSQKQAECSACGRAVNSYMLREDGRVVCKWCSNRNRG